MLRKSLLSLFALAAALTAQTTPPAQQQQRGRGARGAAASTGDANEEANASANAGRGQTMKQLARGTRYAAASMTAASHARRRAHAARRRQRLRRHRGRAGGAGTGAAEPERHGQRRDAAGLRRQGARRSGRSMPKARRRSWRPSSGTRRTRTARFRSTIRCFPATVPGVMDAWYIMLSRGARRVSPTCWRRRSNWPRRGVPIGGAR